MKMRLTTGVEVISLDKPLTVAQASERWGQSPSATRRYFRDKLGVILIRTKKRGVREYVTVLIPHSVLEREIRAVTNKAA